MATLPNLGVFRAGCNLFLFLSRICHTVQKLLEEGVNHHEQSMFGNFSSLPWNGDPRAVLENIITSEQSPARYALENKIKMTIIFAVISER